VDTRPAPDQTEGRPRLGLPAAITACLFDLDGVLTDTASVHAAAWKETFDSFLVARANAEDAPFVPFDIATDYPRHVDGKPRLDGVRDFLASRGVTLPEGTPEDSPEKETVHGLGNRKNVMVLRRIHEDGVTVYDGSRAYLHAAQRLGLRRAVVSSSANTASVLHITDLESLVEERVDGVTIVRERLNGKPAPDTFLLGARRLGVEPAQAAVFEDAIAGVRAGRDGGFGYVVGVDRIGGGHAEALQANGADIVVADLSVLLGDLADSEPVLPEPEPAHEPPQEAPRADETDGGRPGATAAVRA
jgi:beta-phosphoglucomutase family hydrolase